VTSFEYLNSLMRRRIVPRPAVSGGVAGPVYTFTNSARLRSVKVPAGPTGVDTAVTTFTPWDEQGLALAYSGQVGALIADTAGIATRVDGPLLARMTRATSGSTGSVVLRKPLSCGSVQLR
jgi:hypothetical protein